MDTILIRDVGPITTHTLPIAPGVTVLRGANEVGKSTAIACVAALAGRDLDLEARDGTKSGLVEGLGTVLTVGKRTLRTGDLEVESLEDRLDLGTLVDPGLKDGKAANRRRIRTLLSLTGTTLDIIDFQAILPPELAAELDAKDYDEDPVEMAAKIKRAMEKKARACEQEADKQEGKAIAAQERLKGNWLDQPHDEAELQIALEDAIRCESVLKERATAYADAKQARADAAEELDLINATVYGERQTALMERERLSADMVALDKVFADRDAKLQALRDELGRLENQQTQTKCDRINARKLLAAADATLADKEARLADATKLGAIAGRALPPAVTQEQLDRSAHIKATAVAAVARGATIRELLAVKEGLAATRRAQAEALRQAEVYRNAGKGTDEVLSAAVACDTLKVIEGELTYVDGDRRESYSRLSDGKRYQVAIVEVAAAIKRTRGKICVLPLGQVAWEGLDDDNRKIVRDQAVACGVAIVTAEHGTSIDPATGKPTGALTSYRYGESNGVSH